MTSRTSTRKRKLAECEDDSSYEPEEEMKHMDSEDDGEEYVPPSKRRRGRPKASKNKPKAKTVSKPKSKRKPKGRGLTKKAVAAFKKTLKGYVRSVAGMVNADWHDGYEGQTEELLEYMESMEAPIKTVYEFAVCKQRDFDKCHEIMKVIADSWNDMKAVPMRGTVEENLCDADGNGATVVFTLAQPTTEDQMDDASEDTLEDATETKKTDESSFPRTRTFSYPTSVIEEMWALLLVACATENAKAGGCVTDDQMYRFIKDASDYGVSVSIATCDDSEETDVIASHSHLVAGSERLSTLYADTDKWQALSSTVKTYKMRRAIDRRYDGPKNRRTRDFDDAGDCCVM